MHTKDFSLPHIVTCKAWRVKTILTFLMSNNKSYFADILVLHRPTSYMDLFYPSLSNSRAKVRLNVVYMKKRKKKQ